MDVVFEVGGVQLVEEFGVEEFGLGVAGDALDRVFNLADDAPAGGRAVLGGVLGGGGCGFGDFAGEGYGAANGAGDATEGDCDGQRRFRGGGDFVE